MDPPQPPTHRPRLTCALHPSSEFTGFCPSCLRDRLHLLEASTTTSTTHRNSTSTISSSLKSIFHHNKPLNPNSFNSHSATSSSELRRCKSFSFSAAATSASASSLEPQRRSCDVRGRNIFSSLISQNQRPAVAAESLQNVDNDDEIIVVGEVDDVDDDYPDNNDDLKQLPMKDHTDLESSKKPKDSSSGFWIAASVFSKKWQKWRKKQKTKKMKKNEESKTDQKPSRRFHDTQSEIAADTFRRRSVDIAPRYSLDAGRFSFDDPRHSFEEPRASWDGYLIGARAMHGHQPMLAVVEDAPMAVVDRSDGQIPVEEDIYSDTSSRSRRRSLDRSSSVRKSSVDLSDMPQFAHSGEVVRDWSSNSLNDFSDCFESAYLEDLNHNKPMKKSKKWTWSIWGLIHRKSNSKCNENIVERSYSDNWPNRYANGSSFRSNSSLSSSSLYSGSTRKNGLDNKTILNNKKIKEGFALERNSRSSRFSPAPTSGGRRGLVVKRNNNDSDSSYHSFTRSVLGLY